MQMTIIQPGESIIDTSLNLLYVSPLGSELEGGRVVFSEGGVCHKKWKDVPLSPRTGALVLRMG